MEKEITTERKTRWINDSERKRITEWENVSERKIEKLAQNEALGGTDLS